ncbi:MAG: M23 family metallopeptidase [Caldilineaceae bacterium]|nr:M23 family metallopeptidase [Caldilineaceae bacterium]
MTTHQAPTPSTEQATDQPRLLVESRPARLIAARYDRLPFPTMGPQQELVFDLGITALHGAIELSGIVIKGYNEHQMVFEQRWPGRMIRQRTGEADLQIPAGTGLAVRGMHFMLHGYEPLTMVEVTVVGKVVTAADAEEDMHDHEHGHEPEHEHSHDHHHSNRAATTQAVLQMPVVQYENKTDLHFPLRGAWWAIQGSDWSDQHKQEVFSQTYAMDFVKLGPDNHFFRNQGMALEDHYSWEQPVYATAGGKVAYVCYDMPDLPPGTPPNPRMFRDDPRRLLGNAIAISHANGEFSFYGCLQQASAQVQEGQIVRRGTLLGRVGNSGNSPGPHLHFHLMEGPNPFIDQGLPLKFSHFSAGGQTFNEPITIPSRMIVFGAPEAESADTGGRA